MNNQLLLPNKKHTDTLIEKTSKKPHETLDFVMIKQMETFSFDPPINFVEEYKWLLGLTYFKCTNFVSNITKENNSFSISRPSHCNSQDGEEFINELNKFLELRSENDIELHVKEVEKRGTRIEIENSGYILAGFDHLGNEIVFKIIKIKI